ncbi:BTAD domain-containing putative transcriptional regulator [Actinomadura sp. 1N219]|uniref:AfsR/SARP family transcriptional regulator n=1 Tax=Actinomadura sp. 1N219 TaxID=3375152 RepID=UPI003795C771
MKFHVLGPTEIHTENGTVSLRPKWRDLLAVLLCHPNRAVPTDYLIDALWPCTAPRTATKTLHGYVHHLRRVLGPGRLESRRPGYAVVLRSGELDADAFTVHARAGRTAVAAGMVEQGAVAIKDALALWRGTPFEGQHHLAATQVEAFRLTELRLAAAGDWADAELDLGRPEEVVGELYGIVADHPFHERPLIQLMRALYALGRTAEALNVCRTGQRALADELGLDPSPALRSLEHAVLTHDTTALSSPYAVGRP